jgi:5-methylcytosine-specific restriction enzyme A
MWHRRRRSHRTSSPVVISDNTKGFYKDRWENNILYYTGMALAGDQSLDFAQNKTLAESNANGIAVFLFEVFEEGNYIYQGQVQLAGNPFQEDQPDQDNKSRKAWMFPVKLIDSQRPAPIEETTGFRIRRIEERKAAPFSTEELRRQIELSSRKAGTREVVSRDYDRSILVAVYVKRRTNRICELCREPAPFINKTNEPYPEEHHIVWLSKGGNDSIDNTVALCPNCHRKMHVLDFEKDREILSLKANVFSCPGSFLCDIIHHYVKNHPLRRYGCLFRFC